MSDLSAIDQLVSGLPGVREAVAVTDRQLRMPSGSTEPRDATDTVLRGSPIADNRMALSVGPELVVPRGASRTLAEALLTAASSAPDRGTTYVLRDGGIDRQTYRELLDDSRRVLSGLGALGLRPADPVLLQCADNRSFVTGFWACVLGGFLPTPVGPAPDYQSDNAATRKLRAAWELLGHPVVLTDDSLRDKVAGLESRWAAGRMTVASVSELRSATPAEPITPHPDDPVLNLLTSGSTGTPKCVRHANRSIVHRTFATAAANGFTSSDIGLNWMPLDHVGGIVMFNVRDVLLRCDHVNAPTESFVQRPLNWLTWIERFAATNTWAPNFAFALVNRHADEIAAGRWDLASMRNICNAGEAVVPRTAHRFVRLLAQHGLPADSMVACWGMSETSSGVTYSTMDYRDPARGTVSISPASLSGQVETVEAGTPRSVMLTEVGPPIAGVSLRIVDGAGAVLPEGKAGQLEVTGTSMLREYFRNPKANEASFRADGWFATGDLAFLRDGRLCLTGRQKDMVIVNGANYPVHEIEAVVEQAPGVRPARAAVCGVHDEETGTDAVLVFFVPDDDGATDLDATVAGVRTALTRDIALRPKAIVVVTEAEFPRTASGKVQRGQLADAFQAGQFDGRRYDRAAHSVDIGRDWLLERVFSPVRVKRADRSNGPVVYYAPASGPWPEGADGVIRAADEFRICGPTLVAVDPLDPDHHEAALAHLTRGLGRPTAVVHAWETSADLAHLDAPARLLCSIKALATVAPDTHVTVLTRNAVRIMDGETVEPGRAALSGMVRTAVAEGTFASIRMLDLAAGMAPEATTGMCLHDETVVAVRDDGAYAPKLKVGQPSREWGIPKAILPPGGTVLLTGGLGGLGRTVAEYLLASLGARALIVGRSTPGNVLADLAELGDVRYAAVDVADGTALDDVVAEAEQDWGRPLDLVIHLAGASVAEQWEDLGAHELRHESAAWLAGMTHPKLAGGAAVDALLAKRPQTSIVVYSSVTGFFGGSAFGAYAAANAAADGWADRWAAAGRLVRCIGWSMWAGPGMNDGSPLVSAAGRRGLRLIEPSEGLSMLLSALNQPRTHVLAGVDPGNAYVHQFLASDQFAGGSTLIAVAPDGTVDPDALTKDVIRSVGQAGHLGQVVVLPRIPRDASGELDVTAVLAARDARPSRFVEPDGPTESALAQILCDVLELRAMGRDDSFFTLGGDSIRVMQALGGITEWFGRELPISLLYENPTVGELAAALERVR